MKNLLILLSLLTFTAAAAAAQTLSIANGSGTTWSVNTLTTTITGAGKNYEHVETSPAAQTLLKVNAALGWTVSVQQVASSNWDPALKLYIRRTGDGTGGAIIGGGTTFILLTNTAQSFFGGLLGLGFSRDNVPVQYKIEGLSVALPVKTYTTTIQYTVSGL